MSKDLISLPYCEKCGKKIEEKVLAVAKCFICEQRLDMLEAQYGAVPARTCENKICKYIDGIEKNIMLRLIDLQEK